MKNQKAQREFVKDSNQHRDLVKDFYDQDIDHKALEKALTQRKNTAKGFANFSLDPYTGEFGDSQKKHLLNRTMAGYCHRHHKDLDGLSLEESIELIFREDTLKEPTNIYYWEISKEEYENLYSTKDVEPNEPFIDRPYNEERPSNAEFEFFGEERITSIYWSLYGGIYDQKTSIHWKLFLFIHNLVPVSFEGSNGHKGMFNYIELVFNSCFKSYRDFIFNVTFDANMLEYLNLNESIKDTPDENYAREVQELFTVGKRPFAKFTEKDVREAARVLVGCRYDYGKVVTDEGHGNIPFLNSFEEEIFDPDNHDTGDKQFSSFYGNRIIRGREGESGVEEVSEFIEMICSTEEHSIYIARRLYQFFVYPLLTDQIEEQIIKPLSIIYKENNFSLAETLKVLLSSEHFFQNQIENTLIKSPLEFCMGLLKETDIINKWVLEKWVGDIRHNSLFESNSFSEKEKDISFIRYNMISRNIRYFSEKNGMLILDPPSVSGWAPYYQEPVYDLFWLNSSSYLERIDFMKNILKRSAPLYQNQEGNWVGCKFNLIEYLNTFENPLDINSFINELCFRFLGGTPSELTIQRINQVLIGDINNQHWEEEINKIIGGDTPNKISYDLISQRLGEAFELMGLEGEFHLF